MRGIKSAFAILVSAFVLLGLLLSCAPQATPAPAPTPEAAPAKPAWQVEWEKTLAAAQKEGKVVIYGPPGADQRRVLTEGFEKAYPGIRVDYTPGTGSATAPKVESERRAGLYLVDMHIGGTTTIINSLKPFGVPIEPLLILPDVKDGKKWLGGKLDFADKEEKFNLVFTTAIKVAISYNSQMLEPKKAAELAYWDLTKPEWKGKLVMTDCRMAGPGLSIANFFLLNPQLGEKFARALAKNEVLLSRDERLLTEWVARGKYPVHIGPGSFQVAEFQLAGLPIKLQGELKEGGYTTAAYGSLMVLDRAPHPNATKVYINWLLTRDAQLAWSEVSAYSSRRLDVPTGHLDPETVPKPGRDYIAEYKEEFAGQKDVVAKLMKDIFSK